MQPAYLPVGYSDGVDELERRITADGSVTLFSGRYRQTFHSHHGAVAESLHVFLEGSGAGARLRSGLPTRVLEVGFGTGLNFLLTAQAALTAGASLSYCALERDLLPADVVAGLGYQPFAPASLPAYLAYRKSLGERPEPGKYCCEVSSVQLELLVGEAGETALEPASVDALYHDAFSPETNPELWSEPFLAHLAAALAPGGVLVTYTVKGEVRRALTRIGLEVGKVAGPAGGKREMLRATKPGAS